LADGSTVRHPSGVLHRTEIAQVALVAQAAAQVAETAGGRLLPDDPATGTVVAGHSAARSAPW